MRKTPDKPDPIDRIGIAFGNGEERGGERWSLVDLHFETSLLVSLLSHLVNANDTHAVSGLAKTAGCIAFSWPNAIMAYDTASLPTVAGAAPDWLKLAGANLR